MNSSSYSVGNALVDIIAAPSKALDAVRDRVAWLWWPLGISMLAGIGAFGFYLAWVDFDWMIGEVIRTLPPETDPAAGERIRGFMTPARQFGFVIAGIVLMTFAIYLVQSVYLHLVNKVTGNPELRFGQWFAFTAWTAFPGVFQSLAIFVVIAMAESNQLAQHELMPLSFQSLFIHAEPGTSWFNWGNAISLINVWMLGLMTLGIMRWTGAGIGKALLIACTPWVLLFGIWALMIAR